MAVIILHPTEELKLAKLQKEVISDLFEEDRILVAARPLWIRWLSIPKGVSKPQSESDTVIEPVESTEEGDSSEVCGAFDTASGLLNHLDIRQVEFGEIEISENSVFIPVTIITESSQYLSKLTLVNLHSGRQFTGFDRQTISKIKQPVRQLKVFRLGIEKELSPNSKCITDSKWYKIR